jgi:predicted small lipoprotein YifL
VNRPVDRWSRLALVAALAATLGLAACGRKGMLDPPPGTSLTAPQSTSRPSLGEDADSLSPAPVGEHRPARAQGAAVAARPPPEKKSFFLDFLLNK